MIDRYIINIPAELQDRKSDTLLPALEGVLPIRFLSSPTAGSISSGQIIAAAAKSQRVVNRDKGRFSTFIVPFEELVSPDNGLIEIAIEFSDDPDVPFPFRGRSLKTHVARMPKILVLTQGEKSLASCTLGPVWSVSDSRTSRCYRSAFALPTLLPEASLQDILSNRRFIEMIPLLHWLREVCAISSHEGPPLRACFILDDPNLHWPSYGFVDYRDLALRADREHYHISFATIPLDTWFTHAKTAKIFRDNERHLSLAVHGNNHTLRELARPYSKAERQFLLKEAIQRIERLEQRTGLKVSRVMVPPHGACSEEMLAALPSYGFEAACVSHSSLRAHNKGRPWTKTLGLKSSEFICGCPVLPRWGVRYPRNTILLAAFLKQAIILNGHHEDLKDGPELLDELAQFVNSLGSVEWMSMTDMVRSNYSTSLSGRRRIDGLNGSISNPSSGCGGVPERTTGAALEVAPNQSFAMKTHPIPHASLSLIRRLLTEGRDRLVSNRRYPSPDRPGVKIR
jgi:hypothetical protein